MPARVIDFPDEWATSEPVANREITIRPGLALFGVLLHDGSNLYVLIYPGGHRFLRLGASTGFAIEERLEGDPPAQDDKEDVENAWRNVVNAMVDIGKEVDGQLGRMGLQPRGEAWRS